VSMPEREAVELFLQEASEHLQYLREYVSVLQEIEPRREDLERLYIAAHTLSGTSASYGFPHFSEIAGKLAHVFQYSLNATLGEDLHGPLTEFLSDGISLLETDLLEISDTGKENVEDITGFKERYRFAFPVEPVPLNFGVSNSGVDLLPAEPPQAGVTGSYFDALPSDDEVGPEILEFFQPEAEEHLAQLYHYIASEASPDIALNYTTAIVGFCQGLETFPERGNRRDDIRRTSRSSRRHGRTRAGTREAAGRTRFRRRDLARLAHAPRARVRFGRPPGERFQRGRETKALLRFGPRV